MKESDEDFTSLQTLLRLKRYETPPTGSVETFLYEFHRRQRAELVRRPLWRIALDRLENFLPVPVSATPRLAYAGACVAALSLAGAGVLSSRGPAVGGNNGSILAAAANTHSTPAAHMVTVTHNPVEVSSGNNTRRASQPMNLAAANSAAMRFVDADGGDERLAPVAPRSQTRRSDSNSPRPRYVLESQPVRYEPRSSTF